MAEKMQFDVEHFLKLIDIVRDVNKGISMLADNPESKPVAEAASRACIKISDDLELLEHRARERRSVYKRRTDGD